MEMIKNYKLEKFISSIKSIRSEEHEGEKVSTNAIIRRLGFFYEKIRNTLEYKDEHLILESALERTLKRKLSSYASGKEIAYDMIIELISEGYLENNSVYEDQVKKIDNLIERYYRIGELLEKKAKKDISSFLACSIEGVLNNQVNEKEALVEYTLSAIAEKISIDVPVLSQEDLENELYIAIHRTLIKSDYPTIKYHLSKKMIPDLENLEVEESQACINLENVLVKINEYFRSPRKGRMLGFTRKIIPAYSVLGKIVAENSIDKIEEFILDEEKMSHSIEITYSRWKERVYLKISRMAVRSIIFIFFTKMILALLLEVPYDLIYFGSINYVALLSNLAFPPFYMFISTYSIRVPGRENLVIIKDNILKLIFNYQLLEYNITLRKTSSLKKVLFFIIYIFTFIVSFGFLVWFLTFLKFNIVAIILFFIFFSTVSFFAYRIGRNAKDLVMAKEKKGIIDVVVDFFSVPFIKLGQILSSSFSRVNVFLFFLDFIFETPFKTIIQFLDEWVKYAQEKKDDILNE